MTKKRIMKNTTKFLLGFIAGAITGAALGVLFSPKSGTETRDLLKNKIDELANKGKDFYDNKFKNKEQSTETK